MQSNELVSIIVPVYNCEKYIDRCIKSLIGQTYKNLEIIIINDGSTDNSLEIIRKYEKKDTRIKLIDKNNEGVSVARNFGIKHANGKYLTFVDADDWLELNAIEIYHNVMLEYNVDVVRGNYYLNKNAESIYKKGKMYEFSNKFFDSKGIQEKVVKRFLLSKKSITNFVMLLFIRTEIVKDIIHFNEHLFMMEDVAYYFELFQSINNIYFLDYPQYHYFENSDSATKSKNKYLKNIEGIIDTNKYLINLMRKYNCYNKDFEKKLNASNLSTIMNYLLFYVRMNIKSNENKKLFVNFLNSKENVLQSLEINCNNIPLKNKIAILIFKNKWYEILYKYFCLYNYVYKLLK